MEVVVVRQRQPRLVHDLGRALEQRGLVTDARAGACNAIVEIRDGATTVVHAGPPLDGPFALTRDGARWVVTSPSLFRANASPAVHSFTLP